MTIKTRLKENAEAAAIRTGCEKENTLEWHALREILRLAESASEQRTEKLRLQISAKSAINELTRLADELKECSTVDGEWDGSEEQAKEEYDRLMAIVAELESANG